MMRQGSGRYTWPCCMLLPLLHCISWGPTVNHNWCIERAGMVRDLDYKGASCNLGPDTNTMGHTKEQNISILGLAGGCVPADPPAMYG